MSGSTLLPEQEQLLRRLVEARNRLLPVREPFHYKTDYSVAGDIALFSHKGWLKDSAPIYLSDLEALAAGGYILRKSLGNGWKSELTRKALDLYESLRRQDRNSAEPEEAQTDTAPSAVSAPVQGFTDRSVFQKVGQKWVVRYEGETEYLNHTKGMIYLWVLISHCGEDYESAELLDAVEGIEPPSSRSGVVASRQSLDECGLALSDLSDAGAVADEQAVREVWEALQATREELERAKELNDIGKIEELTEQEQHHLDYLGDALRPGGQLSKALSDYDRAKSRVYMNLYRALGTVKEVHPRLHEHLLATVSKTPPHSYRPSRDIDWLF